MGSLFAVKIKDNFADRADGGTNTPSRPTDPIA